MNEAVETVPAWPGFAGDYGALKALYNEVSDQKYRRDDPKSLALILSIMDLSELMGRPFVLMRGGWKRVRA